MKFKEHDVKFHLGSDAHSLEHIGIFLEYVIKLQWSKMIQERLVSELVSNSHLSASILTLII